MSRRRINSARRQSHLRKSSNEGSGELEEDSNVFDADDPLWFKRMEGNNTVLRPSLQFSNADETPADLDSVSCDEMPPPQDNWWNPLSKFNQSINQTPTVRRTIGTNINTVAAAESISLHEESLDSLPERNARKRKTRFLRSQKRQSVESNAFLNALNDSATTVISEPGPSKRKLLTKIGENETFSGEDSFTRTENQRLSRKYQTSEETVKASPLPPRKSRTAFFKKIRSSHSQSATNVFENLLENASSNSEVSTSARDIFVPSDMNPKVVFTENRKRDSTFGSNSSDAEMMKSGFFRHTRKSMEKNTSDSIVTSDEESIHAMEKLNKIQEAGPSNRQNFSIKRRTITSDSKTADIFVPSDNSPKVVFTENRKRDSSFESNSSEAEMMKPGFFRPTRKSMEKNSSDSIATSDQESAHEIKKLNRSQEAGPSNSENLSKKRRTITNDSKTADVFVPSDMSPKVVYTEKRKLDLTFESNSSDAEMKSRFFSRITRSMEKNSSDSIPSSDEESTHDITKLNKSLNASNSNRQNLSMKRRTIKSDSKTVDIFVPTDNSPKVVFTENRKRDSTFESNSSDAEMKIKPGFFRRTRKSMEKNAFDSILTSDAESTHEIEKLNKSQDRISSIKSVGKDRENKKNRTNLNKSENSRSTPISKSNNLRSKLEEREDISDSNSDIDVEGKNNESTKRSREGSQLFSRHQVSRQKTFSSSRQNNASFNKLKNTSQNFDNEKNNSSLSSNIEVPDRMSIFAKGPQFESTRKIDIPKSINSQQSRRVSKLNTTSDRSQELTDKLPRNDKSEEILGVGVFDPKTAISTLRNIGESRQSSTSNNNVSKNTENFRDVTNRNESSENDGTVNSERSQTTSLSEEELISKINNPSPKTSLSERFRHRFIPSDDSTDEENLEENNLAQKPVSKPKITGFKILKPNDIDVKKLKGSSKVVSAKNNISRISSSPPAIRRVSASPRILAKDPQMSRLEQELRQLHGEEYSEIASDSRNIFHRDAETSNSKSIHDLQKNLESGGDSTSEISENPLLIYSENVDEEELNESEYKNTSPRRNLQRKSSLVKEDAHIGKQKVISDYFKYTDEKRNNGPLQPQRISCEDAFKNKDIMEHIMKKVETMVAPIRKELLEKPKNLELPKKKPDSTKKTVKKRNPKPVNPAYLVNGVVYKPPRLPRPKRWATNFLYKFIWKKLEPKYKTRTRVLSEQFVVRLAKVFDRVTKCIYKNYIDDLESLIKEMARLDLIVSRKDFNDFCIEFMPYSFRLKATPILLPGNKMSIPYDPSTLYTPILTEDST